MKLFDRLIVINTFIVAIVIAVVLINPAAQVPSAHVTLPKFGVGLNLLQASNKFHSAEPHIAGVFAEENQVDQSQTNSPRPTPLPSNTPLPTEVPIADPINITIPSINANANIVRVGISAENAMEIPKDSGTVGWYYPAGKPGDNGSAILNGHYDDTSGQPATFYNLRKLKPGDDIIITMQDNKQYVFKVVDQFSHPLESFPHDLLFDDADGKSLKLLTCDGVWNAIAKNYSNRLVVTADLAEIKTQ